MPSNSEAWNVECIRERFTIVKTEITDLNTRNTRLLIALVLFSMALLVGATFYVFDAASGPIFLGILAVLVLISVAIIYLIVNSSEKCVSKLSFCLLTLDDKDVFFKSVSEVSCGGDAITYFLQFVDKATKIIEVSSPGNIASNASQEGK